MKRVINTVLKVTAATAVLMGATAANAGVDFGKPGEKIDLEDMSKETKATAAAVAEWKKRRRMFLDVEGFLLDAAAEGGLTKQKLREDADIEDDEMHGVDCKAAEAMIKTHEAKTKAAVRGTGAPAEGRLNQRMGFLRR